MVATFDVRIIILIVCDVYIGINTRDLNPV
jgi:hypothetical protein